jgi:hypothetical protein
VTRRDCNAEARIQGAVVCWIREPAPEVTCFAILNDGLFTRAEGARRRWLGLVAGIPDLASDCGANQSILSKSTLEWHVSSAQRDMMIRLSGHGALCAICRSVDDVKLAFTAWNIPTIGWKRRLTGHGSRSAS